MVRFHFWQIFKCILLCFSFSLLWGPVNHVKHLCSFGRLPFTAAYFGSMFATLYMAMIVCKHTLMEITSYMCIHVMIIVHIAKHCENMICSWEIICFLSQRLLLIEVSDCRALFNIFKTDVIWPTPQQLKMPIIHP